MGSTHLRLKFEQGTKGMNVASARLNKNKYNYRREECVKIQYLTSQIRSKLAGGVRD